jgi:hypothetical protein
VHHSSTNVGIASFNWASFPENRWMSLMAHTIHGCNSKHEPLGFSTNQVWFKHCSSTIMRDTLPGQTRKPSLKTRYQDFEHNREIDHITFNLLKHIGVKIDL